MNEDIKKYIQQITPESFEALCVEYLRILKGPTYRIKGTRYCKDGGKDIVGTISDEIPYEIWAECKKHSRTVGLEEISKNVVLVLSENINELIFFSTSNIAYSAQRHISNLGARHNFSVAFYYGDNLFEALSVLPVFRKSDKGFYPREDVNIPLAAISKLTKYENPEFYENGDTIILNRDTIFYIDIYIKNQSSNIVKSIHCNIPKCNNVIFYTNKFDTDFQLAPYCERVLQIKAKVLDCKQIIMIPPINISYNYMDGTNIIYIKSGFVDPTKLIYFPLVGVEINNSLKHEIEPLLSEKTRNSYLIDVRGCSGVGKTRFIKEILSLADSYNWHVRSYDGKKEKDLRIIRDLLSFFIGIPYYVGNIDFSVNEIKNILKHQGDNEEFAEILYEFIYTQKINPDTLYYIEESFVYFLKRPYLDYPYLITLDNVQDIDYSVIEFFKHIICKLEYTSVKFILVIGTNIEIIPNYNLTEINSFLDLLENFSDDYHKLYLLEDMKKEDAETLYIHTLKNLKQNSSFLDKMIKKAGTRPFDIIMHIKYMQEQKLIKWMGNDSWYIDDYDGFEKFIKGIPIKSEKIIEKRIKIQKYLYTDDIWNIFKKIIKAVIYFEDCLPREFVEEIQVDEELLLQFMDSLLLKFDDINPEIHFYHYNIYLYFKKIKIYNFDKKLAKEILLWLTHNSNGKYKSTEFRCLLDIGNFDKAKIIGLENLTESMNLYNYSTAIEIADVLLKNSNIELSPKDVFNIKYTKAEAYRERLDHEKGAEIYWELFEYIQKNNTIFDTEELQCQFFHKAINANLNSDHPDKAIVVLNTFSKINIQSLFYKFIMLDRYAVAYLSLGKLEDAKTNIEQAMKIAQKVDNSMWLGIIYSDMAYFYYRGMQDAIMAKTYFCKAYDTQFSDLLDYNRQGELLQQKAFAELLENNLESAIKTINISIDICRKINCTYLGVKAINLKGIIEVYRDNFDNALLIWLNGIDQCQQIKNIVCQIRIYANIGAAYLSTGQNKYLKQAEENLMIALELLKKNHFSALYYKELFYNIIRLYFEQGKQQDIKLLLEQWSYNEFYDFYQYFLTVAYDEKQDYGVMFYHNINFIF